MNFEEVFEVAAQRFLEESPEGRRGYRDFHIFMNNIYGNEPDTRDVVWGYFGEHGFDDHFYFMIRDSDHPFEIHYPTIEGRVTWEGLDSVSMYREDFASMVAESPFLLDRIEASSPENVIIQPLPGMGERGMRYCVIDKARGVGYSVKPYQGGHEKPVMEAFSGFIGPEIFSAGRRSFVEELMIKIDSPNAPNIDYRDPFSMHPMDIAACTGHLFAVMHGCNVIYDAHNWYDEVRMKIQGNHADAKILDFGSSLIWPKRDFLGRHETPLDELIRGDVNYVHQGMRTLFSQYPVERVDWIAEFDRVYTDHLAFYRGSGSDQLDSYRHQLDSFNPAEA